MNFVLNWFAGKFINEDLIIKVLLRVMNMPIADKKWGELWYKAGVRISQEGRTKVERKSWEAVERSIQARAETALLNLHKGFDEDDNG